MPLSRSTSVATLLGLIAASAVVAALGGLATASGLDGWYGTLDKPPWTPPRWAFGPIWTTLYLAMAVAAWDVLRRDPARARPAMALYATQLLLNLAWSPVFFAWHRTGAALAVLSALWVAIAGCIALFWPRSRVGAGLMAPYLAWVSVAWTLNAWIWWFGG